jgi:uncharacterized membrane protein
MSMNMHVRERTRYRQIRPLKLATDWSAGVVAACLLWRHELAWALVVGLLPPILVSLYLVPLVDLTKNRQSAFGQYVAQHMTSAMEALRVLGLALFWFGAWYHWVWLMFLGAAVILAAWIEGVVFSHRWRDFHP